jgi:hypothetical protein
MRAQLRADKVEGGYELVCVLADGIIEYPQEGKTHKTPEDVWEDAAAMYAPGCWQYDPDNHTIEVEG